MATVLLVILGGLLVYWLAGRFELTTEKVYRGYQGEARTNRLLAAERFLSRMGGTVRHLDGPTTLDSPPPTGVTLLIANERKTLGEQRSRELLDWVREGGHLIVQARRPVGERTPGPDTLLDTVGVQVLKIETDHGADARPIIIDVPESATLLEAQLGGNFAVEADADIQYDFGDAYGARLMVIAHGSGLLTVMTGSDWLSNGHIGEYDHARLLMLLVRLRPGSGEVWLLPDDDLPGLWRWAWEKAPEAVIVGGLLLLAWLISVSRRFGPLLPAPTAHRRQLHEHIEAAGYYLWRQGRSDILLASLQQRLRDRIRRRRPDLADLDNALQMKRLADASGVTVAQLRHAFGSSASLSRDAFLRQVQILESIRKRL
jgi:hypothetical protein